MLFTRPYTLNPHLYHISLFLKCVQTAGTCVFVCPIICRHGSSTQNRLEKTARERGEGERASEREREDVMQWNNMSKIAIPSKCNTVIAKIVRI